MRIHECVIPLPGRLQHWGRRQGDRRVQQDAIRFRGRSVGCNRNMTPAGPVIQLEKAEAIPWAKGDPATRVGLVSKIDPVDADFWTARAGVTAVARQYVSSKRQCGNRRTRAGLAEVLCLRPRRRRRCIVSHFIFVFARRYCPSVLTYRSNRSNH